MNRAPGGGGLSGGPAKHCASAIQRCAGSPVTVSVVSADGKTLDATPLTGGKLSLPLADVMAVDVLGGKAAYLSDLKPKAVKEEAFGSVAWPWAADRSVKGNSLSTTWPSTERTRKRTR